MNAHQRKPGRAAHDCPDCGTCVDIIASVDAPLEIAYQLRRHCCYQTGYPKTLGYEWALSPDVEWAMFCRAECPMEMTKARFKESDRERKAAAKG